MPAPPAVSAAGWLVADLDSGDVLAEYEATTPFAPASTLKILTALALAPALDPDATYTATPADAAIDGSKVGMAPGSVYTADDLLHALMLGSGNDAASGLAAMSGGQATAMRRMQRVADDLGASGTTVRNPSGLDDPGQVSTARDLAILARAALANPQIADLVTTRTYQFPGAGTTFGAERPRFEIANHNKLLGAYPGAIGVKNGYTDAARGSFVGAVDRNGRRYVVTLLRAEAPTWRQARDLLDWALANGPRVAPVDTLDVEVPGAKAQTGADADARAVPSLAAPGKTPDVSGVRGLLLAVTVVLGLLLATVTTLRARVLVRRSRRRRRRRRPPSEVDHGIAPPP